MRWHRVVLWLMSLVLCLFAGCGEDTSSPTTVPIEAPRPIAPPGHVDRAPFDVGAVIRQVHFAFRPDGSVFRGGHTTYDVRADAHELSIAPYRAGRAGGSENGSAAHAPALSLRLAAIGREGRSELRDAAPRIASDGHLVIDRGVAVEHLRNRVDGVEQSFVFATRPEGRGDLEVRLRVDGMPYSGETEGGLHFFDRASGLGVRYGKATWIDARGTRVALQVRHDAGSLVVSVPEAVVEGAAYPATIDPAISPEIALDEILEGPAADAQSNSNVVFDGTSYFVVWNDTWAGIGRFVGTHVSPAGAILDPGGVVITYGSGPFQMVATSYGYLLTWGNSNIFAIRVSSAGTALDPKAIQLYGSGFDEFGDHPRACSDGSTTLVAWNAGLQMTWVQPIAADGSLIGNKFHSGFEGIDDVAFDGQNCVFLGAIQNSSSLKMLRISTSGVFIDPTPIDLSIAPASPGEPNITVGAGEYMIAYADASPGLTDIGVMRVSMNGTLLDPQGIPVVIAAGAQDEPIIAYDGTDFVVTWRDVQNGVSSVHGARIDPAGGVLDPNGFLIQSGELGGFDCGPDNCLVTATRSSGLTLEGTDIVGVRLKGNTLLDPSGFLVSTAANVERSPSIASDGTDFFVVWDDGRSNSDYDIYGTRVTAQGTVLDPSGIEISSSPYDDTSPKVSFDSQSYLVVWDGHSAQNSPHHIYGARVDTAGTVLDPSGIVVSTGYYKPPTPTLTSDGTSSLVVWYDTTTNPSAISGARVSNGGVVLDQTPIAVSPPYGSVNPAIAFDGTQYLVTWTAMSAIRGSRVTTAGTPLDGNGLIIASGGSQSAVASDGSNFAVSFVRTAAPIGLFATRVTGAGSVLDGSGISIAAGGSPSTPVIAFDGSAYRVVWRDGAVSPAAISMASLSPGGVVEDPGGIPVSSSLGDHTHPALASNGNGTTLVAYERLDLYSPYGRPHVHARLISATAAGLGAPCALGSECTTGYCVDGVCCDTACGNGASDDCLTCAQALGASADGTCTPLSGIACDDGDLCTQTDTCQAGACQGSSPLTCPPPADACHAQGACDPGTGVCSTPASPDGTACDDGNACTQMDTCQGGACTGADPVVCPAADACHDVAACDPGSGTCAVTPKPDGAPCDDGATCTNGDTCQAGACTSGPVVQCKPLDECHLAGTCVEPAGTCSNPIAPDGTPCSGGVCTNGVCGPDPNSGASSSAGTTSASSSTGAGGAGAGSGAGGSASSTGAGGASMGSSTGAGGTGMATSGSGGSGPSSTGASGANAPLGSGANASEDSGCTFRAPGTDARSGGPLVLGALIVFARRRRRRLAARAA